MDRRNFSDSHIRAPFLPLDLTASGARPDRKNLFTMTKNSRTKRSCRRGPQGCDNLETTSNDETNDSTPLGGAGRDRTDDLMLAKHALSQLSYGPGGWCEQQTTVSAVMVGPVRFELTTPRLSSVCSDQLSYEPVFRFLFEEGMRRRRRPDV